VPSPVQAIASCTIPSWIRVHSPLPPQQLCSGLWAGLSAVHLNACYGLWAGLWAVHLNACYGLRAVLWAATLGCLLPLAWGQVALTVVIVSPHRAQHVVEASEPNTITPTA